MNHPEVQQPTQWLRPMAGYIVVAPITDEAPATELAEPPERDPYSFLRSSRPTTSGLRSGIVVDLGIFAESNSATYISGWPDGLEVGCRVVYGGGGMFSSAGIVIDGFAYINPHSIIGWEPAE
ncbi:MAG: hypothetical protein KGL39_58315 [Patescibacteria group bacterium]|nr:hypothetical protein [Patescibacteria group bacterium]